MNICWMSREGRACLVAECMHAHPHLELPRLGIGHEAGLIYGVNDLEWLFNI